jgi:GNAT superfamily N-acetyltransferase
MSVRVEALTGDRLQAHLNDVARLRIEVFREYPYLYDGDLDYERRYLAAFATSPNAVIVGAFDGDLVVGASTAAPLSSQAYEIRAPFLARGDDLGSYFYFGESVLRRSYRGHGIGGRFFDLREGQARACGARVTTFCSVIRAADHPARPKDYSPLDAFWGKRGYAPQAGLICQIGWKEIGDREESPKPMQFWMKRLVS